MEMRDFQEMVWQYYHQYGRALPWRLPESDGTFDPYKILVSEIMLQQTQAARVVPKYTAFLQQFPSAQALAATPLAKVLVAWSGLGYNRRAKYLHEAAQQLAQASHSWTIQDMVACKGVGYNTAAAVAAYAYNQQVVFIETNIRTVFIHHFFADRDAIDDKEILPLVEQALDGEHPREWYWALMDYGVHLKTTVGNASRSSKHYARQSTFEGSKRQVRGRVLKALHAQRYSRKELADLVEDDRLTAVLTDLIKEKLISETKDGISLGVD
ncbi:MAG TPA: A/G-specific adenine glycosylase [Verrucomicrobiae bacterium]|nr:A/G-specific adenine glycosylase [Verrucomicrobiae bacterium]